MQYEIYFKWAALGITLSCEQCKLHHYRHGIDIIIISANIGYIILSHVYFNLE